MASDGREQTVLSESTGETDRPRPAPPFLPPGPLSILAGRLATAWLSLAATFEREIDAGRGFLWLPVAFGAGILVYLSLPTEPWAPALAGTAAILVAATWRARFRVVAFRVLIVASCVACGVFAAKVRTEWVAAPVMAREATVTVSGWIAAREESAAGGARLYLLVHDIAGLRGGPMPGLARLTVRSHADALSVGDAIRLRARLQPPDGAVMPGSYDFAQAAYYAGIGAVGFAYGAAKPAELGRRRWQSALPGRWRTCATPSACGSRRRCRETMDASRRRSSWAIRAASLRARRTRCAPPALPTCTPSRACTWRWWRVPLSG